MEEGARRMLSPALAPFLGPLRDCYEAGVQVATLPAARDDAEDMRLAALFLKRALTDLRVVWLLVQTGYTAQAASVTSALFEYSLAVVCVAGVPENVEKVLKAKEGKLPWSCVKMSKVLARNYQSQAPERGGVFGQKEYEEAWRKIYGAYDFLCKIKHPTTRSAIHDAFSAPGEPGEFVVMVAPDVRQEDLSMKVVVLSIAITRCYEAIRHFALRLECEQTDHLRDFAQRMSDIMSDTARAHQTVATGPLPFNVSDSWVQRELAELMARADEQQGD